MPELPADKVRWAPCWKIVWTRTTSRDDYVLSDFGIGFLHWSVTSG